MLNKRHPEALKLFRAIEKYSGSEAAEEIAFGHHLTDGATPEQKAAWVKYVSSALEEKFPPELIRKVRADCACAESGAMEQQKAWLRGIYEECSSLEDFVDKMNALGAGWRLEGGTIHTVYTDCSCPMLEGVDRLESTTWCLCTVGFGKELFRHVLGREVEVELVHTIKQGHDSCLVKVTPLPLDS